jgi:mRNA interferase MazF
MRRGDLVTIAGRVGGDYEGKPRPALVIQSDDFPETDSITVALLTSVAIDAPLIRIRIDPTPANNLRQTSWIMIEKIATVRRKNIGAVFGRLSDAELVQLNRALPVFLGLAG